MSWETLGKVPAALERWGVQNPEKICAVLGQIAWRLRRCANIRRKSEAKHCSSLCSQSEGGEYCGGQTRLKIQQSHAPKRWPYSLRVRAPHFASKVSYNAGAATDDCVGLCKSPLRGALSPLHLLDISSLPPNHEGLFPHSKNSPAPSTYLFSEPLHTNYDTISRTFTSDHLGQLHRPETSGW